MQKLQIKEEIMAVAALLALGTLSILAGQATAPKLNVFDIEPKALWALCMYTAHTSGYKIDAFTGFMCLAGGGALADLSIKYFLHKIRFFAGPKGFVVLTA